MPGPEPIESTLGVQLFSLDVDILGTETPALPKGYFPEVIDTEEVAHMGVFPITGHPVTGYKATTAGTAIAIGSVDAYGVIVMADPDNTEDVWVGGSTITTTKAATDGVRLEPGQSVFIACQSLANVYIRRGGSVNQGAYFSANGLA